MEIRGAHFHDEGRERSPSGTGSSDDAGSRTRRPAIASRSCSRAAEGKGGATTGKARRGAARGGGGGGRVPGWRTGAAAGGAKGGRRRKRRAWVWNSGQRIYTMRN